MWWVDVLSLLIGPTLQKSTWCLAAEAIIIGHETEERKRFRKTRWSETGVVADVRDSLVSGIIGAGTVAVVECFQRRLLMKCKFDGYATQSLLPLA